MDLIDRQTALDAIKTAELGCEYEAVEALPSIQPIRCRECAKWNTVFDRTKAEYGLCQIRSQLETTKYDDFCSRAERRTDEWP